MPSVRELAESIACPFEGEGDHQIRSAAPLESAGAGDISFVGSRKARREALQSQAGCLVVPADADLPAGRTAIRAKDPRASFAKILKTLFPQQAPPQGIHPTALIDPTAQLGDGVSVGPYSVIGAGCRIGARTAIGAHCILGEGVVIGEQCLLHARVTFYGGVSTGTRCIFHSGCVLGADGFGYVLHEGRYDKFPQVGGVELGDDVEVGANSTVDRAALGKTRLDDGVKLDNMVHIGHNCRVGRHVVMAAQTGLGGGSTVEEYVVLGGQVGVADNVTIQARAIVGAKSGVPSGKILRGEGQVYWGIPARPIKEYLEGLANQGRIPKIREQLEELLKR